MPTLLRSLQKLWIVAALWLFLYNSFALFNPPLLDDADSVHAEVAREMIQRRDPVTLYANGIRYLEKAPILYWSMAASMKAFGVSAAAARFPLALFALALFLITARFAQRAFGTHRAGIYAGIGLQLCFGLFIFTRILIPDAIVCLWLTAAIFCFWKTEHDPQERSGQAPAWACIGFAAACAANILTKGLIGLVFPIGTVVLYLLITRGLSGTLRRILQLHPIAALVTFLTIAAPWHYLAGKANPAEGHPAGLTHTGSWLHLFTHWSVGAPSLGNVQGWTWFYFMNEHLLRYLDLRVPRDYDTVPIVLFWGLLFIWTMPWSAFLLHATAAAPWRKLLRRSQLTSEDKTLLLLTIAGILPVFFFSFSTRQEYYVLPALPFFILLIARWLDREATEAETLTVPAPYTRAGERIRTALFLVGSLGALICVFFLMHSQPPAPGIDLASLLKQNPGDYALSFGHFLDLNAAAMGAFRTPLAMTAVALFVGTFYAWWQRRHDQPHRANAGLALATLVFLVAAHKGLQTFAPVLSSQSLVEKVRPLLHPDSLIVLNDEYEAGSTLGFYLQRNDIHILHGHSANLWYGSFFTDAPPIFETDESIRIKWLSPDRIFLWTSPDKIPSLPSPYYVVAEGGGKEIISNKMTQF